MTKDAPDKHLFAPQGEYIEAYRTLDRSLHDAFDLPYIVPKLGETAPESNIPSEVATALQAGHLALRDEVLDHGTQHRIPLAHKIFFLRGSERITTARAEADMEEVPFTVMQAVDIITELTQECIIEGVDDMQRAAALVEAAAQQNNTPVKR